MCSAPPYTLHSSTNTLSYSIRPYIRKQHLQNNTQAAREEEPPKEKLHPNFLKFSHRVRRTQDKRMGSVGIHIVCVFLGLIGLIGIIVCCALPQWKVTSFTGSNIVTAQRSQQGLWMTCVVQSTGQQQCKNFESMLVLPSDLQAARAMTIIACMISSLSLLILFCGADFTTCIQNEEAKPKISLVAGVGMMLAGLLVIIPVSWSAHVTVREFNNPLSTGSPNMELGACVFVGWAAGVLLLLGGGLLCCFSRPKSGGSGGTAKYYSNSASAPNKNYV